jgi:hypothetical protein
VRDAIPRAKRERFVPVIEVVDRESPTHAPPHHVDLLHAVAGLMPQQRAPVGLYYREDRPADRTYRVGAVDVDGERLVVLGLRPRRHRGRAGRARDDGRDAPVRRRALLVIR